MIRTSTRALKCARPNHVSSYAQLRSFSLTQSNQLRTSELTESNFSSLKANPDRLWNSIHSTAKWGTGKAYGAAASKASADIDTTSDLETGMSRLTLSDTDKQARDWFVSTTKELGCEVFVDAVGNTFAIRPGLSSSKSVPATFAGSHLDSQPTGGRFDGILGVCAGVEMLRVLNDNWIETEGPIGVVNWTNEEGARFSRSMMGSGVWAGALPLEDIYKLEEVSAGKDGRKKTVKEELEKIGYLGDVDAKFDTGVKLGAHFELHIEQGPHLVRAGEHVGVVAGVQAYKWFTVQVTGRDCHTGATGFDDRADALMWASKLIWSIRDIAKAKGGLASVGIIHAAPGSVNTVPGLVTFSLDVRHHQDEKMLEICEDIKNFTNQLESESREERSGRGVKFDIKQDFHSPATHFDKTAIQCIDESAQNVTQAREIRKMTSGAGHDSVFTSWHCPTAMIFVPCKDGVSHHPEEWCEKEDCATGASTLLQSVLRMDKIRKDRGDFE